MQIQDFKNKKITVMGLGLHGGGVGAVKFLVKRGVKVLVTDLRSREDLRESLEKLKGLPVKYVLGQHRQEDFSNTDMVLKNPAIPPTSRYLRIAHRHKVPIETDIGIFFELAKAPIIGVTGTKGKGTVAFLIHQFLTGGGKRAVLAGNIGFSVLEALPIPKGSLVVLELSSFQLEDLKKHKKSPRVAVITNIMPDHMDRYKSMEEYIEAKKIIFQFQGTGDWLVLNYDDERVRGFGEEAKSQKYFYGLTVIARSPALSRLSGGKGRGDEAIPSLKQKEIASSSPSPTFLRKTGAGLLLAMTENERGAFVRDGKIFFGKSEEEICSLDDIRLPGKHNLSNVLAAVTVACLYKISPQTIRKVLRGFKGLKGRLEFVREVRGVKYYNDTKATTPEATIAAINALEGPLILIAGGSDKGLNFDGLAREIGEKVKVLILLEGIATDKLKKAVGLVGRATSTLSPLETQCGRRTSMRCKSMEEAVQEASRIAKQGDTVLLSPACTSFGMFRNAEERGEIFERYVGELE